VLTQIEALDNGKTRSVALESDLPLVIKTFRYYAGYADKIHGKQINVSPDIQAITRLEPLGVVGQIIPWYFRLIKELPTSYVVLEMGSSARSRFA
jgi:aldehyde dehydrogenase (NAD+)